ncbi:MAG: hypothetical protein C0621_09760 [Desulfuromonas sp.]|nr:MAG: hypothetical protein C0621_09760 [Desulfuromonas sp.]
MSDIPTTDAPAFSREEIVQHLKEKDPTYLKLIAKLNEVSNNLDFLKDDAWIERAIKGLDKPNIDERVESQIRTNVLKELRNKAAMRAEVGEAYVAPTKEQVDAVVDRRKSERQQAIEDKMNQKIAKAHAALASQS